MSKTTLCEACGKRIDASDQVSYASNPVLEADGTTSVYGFAWHPACRPKGHDAIYEYVNRKARERGRS